MEIISRQNKQAVGTKAGCFSEYIKKVNQGGQNVGKENLIRPQVGSSRRGNWYVANMHNDQNRRKDMAKKTDNMPSSLKEKG